MSKVRTETMGSFLFALLFLYFKEKENVLCMM